MQVDSQKTAISAATQPNFGLPADVTPFAHAYEVFSRRRSNSVAFDVCDLSSSGVTAAALRKRFKRDQSKESSCKLNWTAKRDVFTDLVPDFADELHFNYLKSRKSKQDTGNPLENTYLVVAKDADGRVISYAAATITMWFDASGLEPDCPGPDAVWSWLIRSKRRKLELSVKLDLHEVYTVADSRGLGASSAAMGYLAEVFHTGVQNVIDALGRPLAQHRKKLKFDFILYSEWESKSGCLASGHLLDELNNVIHDLAMMNDDDDLPIQLPDAVMYDAGF